MAPRFKLSQTEVQQAIELYNWGFSLDSVGRLFGVSGTTIHRYMNIHGIPRRPAKSASAVGHKNSLKKNDIEELVRLYELGFSIKEVASFMHVSPTCARTYLINAGVTMRQQGGWAYNKYRIPSKSMDATIWLYRDMGLTAYEVGDMLGISHSTVLFRLRKAGVTIRTRSESVKMRWLRAPRVQRHIAVADELRR